MLGRVPRALGLPADATLARDVAFTQGVASGEPTPGGITLWTHLDGLEAPASLTLEVSRDPGFGSVLVAVPATATPDAAGAAQVRLEDTRLLPGEQYWYRFAARDADSPVGRFRTARPPDSREPVRIAFFSCQDWLAGYYGAHADLASRDDIDLVVCLGDYVYERAYISSSDRNPPVRADDSAGGGEAQTLDEYRRKYALYHSDPHLLAMRAAHTIEAIWDDHEVEDNYADGEPGEATHDRRIPFLERRANSYRAFFEHMPRARVPADPDRIYGSLSLGSAEIFLLDSRQYRDQQPCKGSVLLDFPCLSPEVDLPGRTLLGKPQMAWLKDGLQRSPAPWKVIANQVMVMSLDLLPRIPLNVDSWDGYGAERRELIDHIAAAGIPDVTFITGDIHTFFAGDVTRTGRELLRDSSFTLVDGPARATEFVGGAITSPGIVDRLAGPSEAERVHKADGLDKLAMLTNPHLAYVNQAYKGYAVMEASEAGLAVEYRAVRDARIPDSPCFTLRRFSVARGVPHVVDEGGPAIPL
ncbi:MAG: alkaline phosphatase [Miltoncostaeaceae bacterium]|nr:alkaline phosphatase [Miltoncostaeaceae bacterium]